MLVGADKELDATTLQHSVSVMDEELLMLQYIPPVRLPRAPLLTCALFSPFGLRLRAHVAVRLSFP